MKIKIGYLLASALVAGVLSTGCTEEIDMSNRYTFTGQTCKDYIESKPEFSEYYRLLCNTPISSRSKSTLAQLLSIRGYFTVFPPTNDAIKNYLALNAEKGLFPEGFETLEELSAAGYDAVADSLQDVITRNSIIDNSRDGRSFWYINDLVTQTKNSGELQMANMNNRYLAVIDSGVKDFIIDEQLVKKQMYYVEKVPVRNVDIEVFNGVIQEMDGVVAPTNDNVFDILKDNPHGFTIMSSLMQLTGWDEIMSDQDKAFTDRAYNDLYLVDGSQLSPKSKSDNGRWYQISISGGSQSKSYFPERRDLGYTVFAEVDSVFRSIGMTGEDPKADIDVLRDYLKKLINPNDQYNASTTWDDNYKDSTNFLHQFIGYHILPFRATYDQLVVHYNELGYNGPDNARRLGMMVSEYYETAGWPRRIMKFSHGITTDGMRINRVSTLHRSKADQESRVDNPGVYVFAPGESKAVGEESDLDFSPINPLNGYVYPIEEMLVYSDEFRKALARERIRFDVTAALPEMITNKQRRPRSSGEYISFPNSYQYLSRMWLNEEAVVCYLPGTNAGWANMQGDEFNINGQYEVTIQMPPVPEDGTYEIRFGVSASGRRGMCQVYFGPNRQALPAAGIPLDIRLSAANYGWVVDDKDDDAVNNEVDKKLRNNSFMKAPASYRCRGFTTSYDHLEANVLRNNTGYAGAGNIIRRVVVRQDMKANETYYIKFKNVLSGDDTEFFFDYLELCPKSVYDNPSLPEDIW